MKKVLAILICFTLVVSIVSCTKKTDVVKTDLSKEIVLKWVMPGPGIQPDSKKVWEEFNNRLRGIPGFEHVTVDVEIIPFSEYAQKFLLMQTSSAQMDIIQTYSLDFATESRNGSFLDLTKYLSLVPDLVNELPQWILEMGKVDGEQAIITNYQKMAQMPYALIMPKALADKYADVTKMKEVFQKADYFDDNCYDVLEEYLEKVRQAGAIGTGFNSSAQAMKGYQTLKGNFGIRIFGDGVKVVYTGTDLSSEAKYRWVEKFYKKGYIREDVLSAKRNDKNGVEGGNIAWFDQLWGDEYVSTLSKQYGMEVVAVPLDSFYYITNIPSAGGLAINAETKYPDVAMKFIELMNTEKGKDLYNLMVYGLKDVHYTVVGKDRVSPIGYVGEGTSSAPYGIPKWVVGNASNAWVTDNEREDFIEYIYSNVNEGENTVYSKLMGFSLDFTMVENKVAQINSINSEYGTVLGAGVGDFNKSFKEYKEKLQNAGVDDIINELQRQIDEFLAEKN